MEYLVAVLLHKKHSAQRKSRALLMPNQDIDTTAFLISVSLSRVLEFASMQALICVKSGMLALGYLRFC